jgi:histidinol-phosphate aminotransferase
MAASPDATTPLLPDPIEPVAATTRSREGGSERRGLVGLDRNERVGELPAWFLHELRAAIDSDLLTTYPATDELHSELAAALDLPGDQVLVTPGTDPVLKATCQVYVRPGDGIAMLDPSYAMYAVYARMFGAMALKAPFDRNLEPDVDALLESVQPGTRVVFLANPNQPTGTLLSDDVLRELLARAERAGTIVLVDEAYHIFSRTSALPLLAESPNLLVARSFSKAGFAGVRIGYVAGSPEVVGNLFKVRSAGEVNAIAAVCARMILRRPEVATDYADELDAARELLASRAQALGLTPLSGYGNFMLIRTGDRDPASIVEGIRRHGFLIRGPFPDDCLAGCIRVTLAPRDVIEAFADALDEVVAQQP